ncbi:MAG: class B sortase [Coriobacteriia bacterium]|nr:class B sortase [Coriobacteriia bacterium]
MVERRKRRVGRVVFVVLLVYFLVIGAIAAYNIISTQAGYSAAQNEYKDLRAHAPAPISTPAATPEEVYEPLIELLTINPECVGWIWIAGTAIDYPVAQSDEDEYYLHHTFSGESNYSGAIFMDSRCVGGFNAPVAILYGHNMMDGSMFAGLNLYREDGYLADHPVVNVVDVSGRPHTYRIFLVRHTDMYDESYALPGRGLVEVRSFLKTLGAPADARVLVLSTCTNTGGSEERLLIFATEE